MNAYLIGLVSAFWFGILTSIAPCPLATNIAATSFIGKKAHAVKIVIATGILYAIGRMVAYTLLGLFIAWGLLKIPVISFFLQRYMNIILGPLLIIVGMFLLNLLELSTSGSGLTEKVQKYFKGSGVWGALLIGIIFSLAFCPVSAALFFGSLIPISLKINSPFLAPAMYGFGTAAPVLLVTLFFAIGSKSISKLFKTITTFEKWVRIITGVLIITVGIYFCIANIFLA